MDPRGMIRGLPSSTMGLLSRAGLGNNTPGFPPPGPLQLLSQEDLSTPQLSHSPPLCRPLPSDPPDSPPTSCQLSFLQNLLGVLGQGQRGAALGQDLALEVAQAPVEPWGGAGGGGDPSPGTGCELRSTRMPSPDFTLGSGRDLVPPHWGVKVLVRRVALIQDPVPSLSSPRISDTRRPRVQELRSGPHHYPAPRKQPSPIIHLPVECGAAL